MAAAGHLEAGAPLPVPWRPLLGVGWTEPDTGQVWPGPGVLPPVWSPGVWAFMSFDGWGGRGGEGDTGMGASSLHSCPCSVTPCMKLGQPLPSHSLQNPICAMGISTLCSHRSLVIPNSHSPGFRRGGPAESHCGRASSWPLWEPAECAGVKDRGSGRWVELPSNHSSATVALFVTSG